MKALLRSLYLDDRFFYGSAAIVALGVLGYFWPLAFIVMKSALLLFLVLVILDILILYRMREGLFARRGTAEKFSNGDDNLVEIYLESFYNFTTRLSIIDEVPVQFQKRDQAFHLHLSAGASARIEYRLRPVARGEYHFGCINVFVASPIGLIQRRYRGRDEAMVPVYPSFMQMRRYELLAISNRLGEAGVKKIRRIGHSMEFDQIRQYVPGDDVRTVNWKATARSHNLMVNQFQDERSQQVFSIIDMGRVMKMPFDGLTLLDYAINACLVISNIAMLKYDKAGLMTFAHEMGTVLPAERKKAHLNRILEVLYNQETGYLESNYEAMYAALQHKVRQRSLIVLFTNFETVSSMRRQLPYLRGIARRHVLVTIFFENTELRELLESQPKRVEDIYIKTIGEHFAFQKREIVKELERFGIHSILTPPEQLTVNTINRYLELKARGLI